MRIKFLDNITGKWANQWMVGWFICGAIALTYGFWETTDHGLLDMFYLTVSLVGLVCVVSLAFRKNVTGNGLGIIATVGEMAVNFTAGSVGLVLAPLYNFFTHVYGLFYWAKNTDDEGNMVPKSANKWVWVFTLCLIGGGLLLFPVINDLLAAQGYAVVKKDGEQLFSGLDFYWVNVFAFILAITAQTTMILRYKFSWWIWIVYNFIGFTVHMMAHNYIFAIQMVVYQVNSCVAVYEWYRGAAQDKEKQVLQNT